VAPDCVIHGNGIHRDGERPCGRRSTGGRGRISERSAGCGAGAARAADPQGVTRRATAQGGHAGGDERHSLPAAHRVPLALSAARQLPAPPRTSRTSPKPWPPSSSSPPSSLPSGASPGRRSAKCGESGNSQSGLEPTAVHRLRSFPGTATERGGSTHSGQRRRSRGTGSTVRKFTVRIGSAWRLP
jgi:hypothetical protein